MAKKILVVDDSPTQLKMATAPLIEEGYEVITATNGEEALQQALAERPDVIVLDVVMPIMDGFQACRKIKASPDIGNTPVIMLTSKNQKADEFWGKRQGADVYLTKPFEAEDLLAAVGQFLA